MSKAPARLAVTLALLFSGFGLAGTAAAEPYLAARSGQKCAACHVNPTGGGKRTEFGAAYGFTELPATDDGMSVVNGRFNEYFAMGGNLRFNYQYRDIPDADPNSEFDTARGSLYLQVDPLPNRLTLYADHDFALGRTREVYALMWNADKDMYLKAGRFFLPFGYRYEDDTSFVRSVSGISMTSADNGVEAGLERGPWSLHAALSNGSSGGSENDTGKQLSLNVHYVQPGWRAGAGLNRNDAAGSDDKDMLALFGMLRLGGMEWLAEIDLIEDSVAATGAGRRGYASLLEVNRRLRPGHNLKLTLAYYEPDADVAEDEQNRASLVWEYSPLPLVQWRLGYRAADGIPQNPSQNTDLLFGQLHTWF